MSDQATALPLSLPESLDLSEKACECDRPGCRSRCPCNRQEALDNEDES